MGYRAVLAYDQDGGFVGFAIQKEGTLKLHGSNLYAEGEEDGLKKQLARLNESELLQKYWPDANDPEVQQLLADPTFEAATDFENVVVPVLDEEASTIVYDENNIPSEEQSNLVYTNKTIRQPTNNIERGHKAMETVARRRIAREA